MNFGELIRNLRIKKKIGLREFAAKIGISPTFVSKMENGDYKPPKEETIRKMALVLGENEDFLLAQAKKISTDIKEIIYEDVTEGKKIPEFLRLSKEKALTPAEWEELIDDMRKRK